ncbi:uncharacterized protein LOC135387335 isoform X1 [Ornithodoros turicata]|uniref:uncharacterized protein LOC135387335 isoform X1 n=2 Tax=Ornithodoros turicata TaxID=34597 RepID=UPI0031392D0D
MFTLCGCDDDSFEEEERRQRRVANKQTFQAQGPQKQNAPLKMPPSEGELVPEFSVPPQGLEQQPLGAGTASNASMKTANYCGMLELGGSATSCSKKRSVDSADVIKQPLVSPGIPENWAAADDAADGGAGGLDIPGHIGGSSSISDLPFRRRSSSSTNESPLSTSCSSVKKDKEKVRQPEERDSGQCSCPMYELDVTLSHVTTRPRENPPTNRLPSTTVKDSEEKMGLQVITTETVTRRQYTYNVDVELPKGMRVSPRGKLVQDQGASAGEARVDYQPYCPPLGYVQQSELPQYIPASYGPNFWSPETGYQPYAESFIPNDGEHNSMNAASKNRHWQQVPRNPSRPGEHFSDSKADLSVFQCACNVEIGRSNGRHGVEQGTDEHPNLIRAEFACIGCGVFKMYLVCKLCYTKNKIRYCKECSVYAKVESREDIPLQWRNNGSTKQIFLDPIERQVENPQYGHNQSNGNPGSEQRRPFQRKIAVHCKSNTEINGEQTGYDVFGQAQQNVSTPMSKYQYQPQVYQDPRVPIYSSEAGQNYATMPTGGLLVSSVPGYSRRTSRGYHIPCFQDQKKVPTLLYPNQTIQEYEFPPHAAPPLPTYECPPTVDYRAQPPTRHAAIPQENANPAYKMRPAPSSPSIAGRTTQYTDENYKGNPAPGPGITVDVQVKNVMPKSSGRRQQNSSTNTSTSSAAKTSRRSSSAQRNKRNKSSSGAKSTTGCKRSTTTDNTSNGRSTASPKPPQL